MTLEARRIALDEFAILADRLVETALREQTVGARQRRRIRRHQLRHDEHGGPERGVRYVSGPRRERRADRPRVEPLQQVRLRRPVDGSHHQIQNRHRQQLVVERRHAEVTQQRKQRDDAQPIEDAEEEAPQLGARRRGGIGEQ